MNNAHIEQTVSEIAGYFRDFGQGTYEEACTQQAHGQQCGTFALQQNLDIDMAIAAFLHDIGHFIAEQQEREEFNDFGYAKHSEVGAKYLAEKGFSERIVRLVNFHVQAKRYLAATEDGYIEELSSASIETMKQQGGPMNDTEVAAFEQQPDFEELVTIRRLDELGKLEHMEVKPMSFWLDACRDHLLRQNKT